METQLNENILLYPIGFDLSRLDIILENGVLSETEYEKRGLDFIKNTVDSSISDSIMTYRYGDIINGNLEEKVIDFISNSICIVIKNNPDQLFKEKIDRSLICGIIIPYDYSLGTLEYFHMNKLPFEEIKRNCEVILKFLSKYGFEKDQEKYENSYKVLEYSFKCADAENNEDMEEARNYLNEDIGYDVEETFKQFLNNEQTTLYDVVHYLNKKTINVNIDITDFANSKKKNKV